MKKTVKDIEVKGKKVLVRCDFNVPMQDGKITDDVRIRAALPTIEYLKENGAQLILMSHMGRPKGEPKKEFTLAPVAQRLAELLGCEVKFAQSDVVVDDSVMTIGSCNFDIRSFALNFEANVVIYSEKEAKKYSKIFDRDIRACEVYDIASSKKKSLMFKMLTSLSRLFSAVL